MPFTTAILPTASKSDRLFVDIIVNYISYAGKPINVITEPRFLLLFEKIIKTHGIYDHHNKA